MEHLAIELKNSPDEQLPGIVSDLYKAGMSVYQIAYSLGIPREQVRGILNIKSFSANYSPYPKDLVKQSEILNKTTNLKGVVEGILSSLERKMQDYSAIETKSLRMAEDLLEYYSLIPAGDLNTDKFKLDLMDKMLNRSSILTSNAINLLGNMQKGDLKVKDKDENDRVIIEIVGID